MSNLKKLKRDSLEVNWGEVKGGEHFIQIYEDESVLLDSLSGYVTGGLRSGEGVVVIATPERLELLEERLFESHAIDVRSKSVKERYFPYDADDTLGQFMVGGMPDEGMFRDCIIGVIEKARAGGRSIRAFGEMVVLLWNAGNVAATIRLEELWHALCRELAFPLFCAYPKTSMPRGGESAMTRICREHSKMVII